jgi:hypothetical protein
MGGMLGAIVAGVVGMIVAGGLAFGLVSSQTATPPTVDAPYIVYGTTS